MDAETKDRFNEQLSGQGPEVDSSSKNLRRILLQVLGPLIIACTAMAVVEWYGPLPTVYVLEGKEGVKRDLAVSPYCVTLGKAAEDRARRLEIQGIPQTLNDIRIISRAIMLSKKIQREERKPNPDNGILEGLRRNMQALCVNELREFIPIPDIPEVLFNQSEEIVPGSVDRESIPLSETGQIICDEENRCVKVILPEDLSEGTEVSLGGSTWIFIRSINGFRLFLKPEEGDNWYTPDQERLLVELGVTRTPFHKDVPPVLPGVSAQKINKAFILSKLTFGEFMEGDYPGSEDYNFIPVAVNVGDYDTCVYPIDGSRKKEIGAQIRAGSLNHESLFLVHSKEGLSMKTGEEVLDMYNSKGFTEVGHIVNPTWSLYTDGKINQGGWERLCSQVIATFLEGSSFPYGGINLFASTTTGDLYYIQAPLFLLIDSDLFPKFIRELASLIGCDINHMAIGDAHFFHMQDGSSRTIDWPKITGHGVDMEINGVMIRLN